MTQFNKRLEQIRKRLLDLSKRNKLINYRRPNKSKNLKIIDESPEFIYHYLLKEDKTFRFKSIPYPTTMPHYRELQKRKKAFEKDELLELEIEKNRLFYTKSWTEQSLSLNYIYSNKLKEHNDTFLQREKTIKDKFLRKEKSLKKKYQAILDEIETIESNQEFTVESQAKEMGLVISKEMPEIELTNENNFDIHTDSFLQTLHFPDDLERILKNIELNARSIMDVTGSNMLYLVLGILEWREANKPDIIIKSPLITIPVLLKRGILNKNSNTYEYTLSYSGDIIDTNESLSQKLFSEFKIKLPILTEESSFNNYIKEIKKISSEQKNWKVRQEISLDFLQFGKILMYKDLGAENLQKNPILQDIFLGRDDTNSSYALEEYQIESEPLSKNMPLILDADSSQQSAMIDVLKGKNVVIEGPPGSGKSQIIANLIAILMNEGKSVLFVSEKLVALEVVYQRLEQVGLGDFCLELHSHKTDKLSFLKNIYRRIEGHYPAPFQYEKNQKDLEDVKFLLNEYLDVLHKPYGSNNKTIFENIWLREYYLEGERYFKFKITNAQNLTSDNLQHCEEYLKEYQLHYADFDVNNSFWSGFEMSKLSFLEIDKFIALFSRLKTPYAKLQSQFKELKIKGCDEPLELERVKKFLEDFTPIESYHFPYSAKNGFQNLEDKLQSYLKTFVGYLTSSEIHNLSTEDILKMVSTSSSLLAQLAEFEHEFSVELIAFEKYRKESQKSFDEFEKIEKENSKNLYIPIVNQKRAEDIYHIVRTIMDKKDSWFNFLSPSYKRAKGFFASMLKERLPKNSDDWTFLLRELNIYTLNRENQLTLRLSLMKRVPIFIEKIEGVNRKIKETLDCYNAIEKSPIDPQFKALLYDNINNVEKFKLLVQNKREVDNILKAIINYGIINKKFYGEYGLTYQEMIEKLEQLESNKKSLTQWIGFQELLNKLKSLGLQEMMKSSEKGEIPKDNLIDTFYYNYYESLIKQAFIEFPILEKFNRVHRDNLIKKFRKLDAILLNQNQLAIAHKLSKKKLPPSHGTGKVATFTNVKLLTHEVNKKIRHVPIRQLLKRAGDAIHVLKPCFMMSPLSVAQYIPIDESKFDVILIDEASQMKPEEALGVIARAKQVVVVGDPKQLPPTSFFDVIQEENRAEEKTILDDSESILDSFMELYSPIRRLKWHYRSQHESLISFSNRHFYDNELTIFPSASSKVDEKLGLKYTYVEDGIYKSGNLHRTNSIEAEAVLKTILYQMKKFPKTSLGVGTLNSTQKELIQELVDEAEKEHTFVATYIEKWKDNHEEFFVKNLESLQGDERDVILISTTYGKEEGSERLNQRFGPINQESGWRRLNVLITRAKQKMHIFTSMQSSEINITDSSSRGIRALRDFLKFLEMGEMAKEKEESNHTFNSTFSKVVYQILRDKGIKVIPNVGVSGYYIDLAVISKKDGRYILAIECDGETYYNAKSSSDRERLKVEALERLDWDHYHIWSAEWYKNREVEIDRLLKKIDEAEGRKERLKKEAQREKEAKIKKEIEKIKKAQELKKKREDEKLEKRKREEENKQPKQRATKERNLYDLNNLEKTVYPDDFTVEELNIHSTKYLHLLNNFKNLKLLILPFDIVLDHIDKISFPEVQELFIDTEYLSNDKAVKKFLNPNFKMDDFFIVNKENPLEILRKVLRKQPYLHTFGYIHYEEREKDKFIFISMLEQLMEEFSNLEKVYYFFQSENYFFEDFVTIERDEYDEEKFIYTGFSDSFNLRNYNTPDFLLSTTTLKTLLLPHLKSLKNIEMLLHKNKDIQIFQCSWDSVSPDILSMEFKNFKVDRKYAEKYELLQKELNSIEDSKKDALFRLLLSDKSIPFTPKKMTLIKLMQSKVYMISNRAIEAFEKYHPTQLNSLNHHHIFLSLQSEIYNKHQLKELLISKFNSKLTSEITKDTNLIVVGKNNILQSIPDNVLTITMTHFEKLLANKREKNVVDNETLINLLNSEKDEKVLEGLEAIKEDLNFELLAMVLGIFKVYPNLKIRKKALICAKQYGGTIAIDILKICERKRYLSTSNEKNFERDFKKMEKIEGFDIDGFAKYIAWHHPLSLGNYRFINQESDETKKFILEKLNREKVVLLRGVHKLFFKATKIKILTVGEISESLWRMDKLKRLMISINGKSIHIPPELSLLRELKELHLYAKDITINGSSLIESLIIQGANSLTLEEDALFENVTTLFLMSSNNRFKVDIVDLKRAFPNLKSIQTGVLFDSYNFKKDYKEKILELFPNIEFKIVDLFSSEITFEY